MGAGRWGQRAEVGAAARERALVSGADLLDLPVSWRKRRGAKRGLARGDTDARASFVSARGKGDVRVAEAHGSWAAGQFH